MGRHSRKGPAPQGTRSTAPVAAGEPAPARAGSGKGRRGRGPDGQEADPEQQHGGPAYATPAQGVPQVRGGHPEQREAGGGWGGERRQSAPRGPAARAAAPPKQPGAP
ncbi:hypothetical protein M1203_03115, partial [Streptomyces sp. 35G-GA-8]|nr:hypothetical protein [Streptomyces sp. 35G-GA-8]